MLKKTMVILSASALALAACGQKNDTANTTDASLATNDTAFDAGNVAGAEMNTTAPASGAQSFVNTAAASDAFEIATSKLALENSSSAKVKTYANQMIAAHTASTDKLKATTATLTPALMPDPKLNAEQQTVLDTLKTKKGADFDIAYIAAQQAGHQQTLDVLKGYGATGDVPALKTFATGLTPTVAAHLNMAKGLKA